MSSQNVAQFTPQKKIEKHTFEHSHSVAESCVLGPEQERNEKTNNKTTK